jgi:ABC-type amino acid transport substrate-binding protein
MKEVDFSSFVFVETTGIVVARAPSFRSVADMPGRKIAVVAGTTNERAMAEQIRQRKLDLTLVPVKDRDEGIAALETGKVDGYASDKLLLLGAQVKNREALAMLPDELSVEPYAIALPRGDWEFRLAVNTALAQVFRSGQGLEVFKRWFDRIGLQPGILLGAVYTLGSLAD